MRFKAISPLVAVVLLIFITLSTGMIITIWVKNFVVKYTTMSPLECALNAQYTIDSAEYDSSRKEVVVRLTNKGTIDLYGFTVILDNSMDIKEYSPTSGLISLSPEIGRSNPLKAGRSAILRINVAAAHELAQSLKQIKVLNEVCIEVSASTESILQR